MKFLVTGGAGFIGSNLCRELLKEGHFVICLDDLSTGRYENISKLEANPSFEFVVLGCFCNRWHSWHTAHCGNEIHGIADLSPEIGILK